MDFPLENQSGWWLISTPLKNMKVNWDGKIKNIPNHQAVNNVHKYGEPMNVYDFSMKYGEPISI